MRRHTRSAARALVAGCLAGLALAGAPPAQARTVLHTDPAHDVRSQGYSDDETHDPPRLPAPRHHDGDITHVRMWNGPRVGIRVTFDDLRALDLRNHDHWLRVVTDGHLVRDVEVAHGRALGRGAVLVRDAGGDIVDGCRVGFDVDTSAHLVVIRVARACLGDPRWVRLGYVESSYTPSGGTLFLDDALRDRTAAWSAPLLSGRIWRH